MTENSQRTEEAEQEQTIRTVENHLYEELEWPQYFVSGGGEIPLSYYEVFAPNGPVYQMQEEGEPTPTTMYDLIMEAQGEYFRHCDVKITPFEDATPP